MVKKGARLKRDVNSSENHLITTHLLKTRKKNLRTLNFDSAGEIEYEYEGDDYEYHRRYTVSKREN